MHNSKAVVAQELKHSAEAHNVAWLLQLASLAQRVWCAIKTQKKIFQGQGASASYLERPELVFLYGSLDNQTTLKLFKLKEQVADYT